jgi:nucleotide-binding universal stress UspA family protein
VTPDFEELNTADALANARIGADLAAPTWDGVVEAADDIDAAVIVIGSRGLTGAQELLKGSLSHDVAEHAGRPVLIVPPRHGDGSR